MNAGFFVGFGERAANYCWGAGEDAEDDSDFAALPTPAGALGRSFTGFAAGIASVDELQPETKTNPTQNKPIKQKLFINFSVK